MTKEFESQIYEPALERLKNKAKISKNLLGLIENTKNQTLRVAIQVNPNACIADEEKMYRLSASKTVAVTNISADTFGKLTAWIDSYSGPGLQVRDVKNLVRDYAGTTLDTIVNNIRSIQRKSFAEYSLSMDRTPSFAHAECIIMRFILRSFDIYELVVRVVWFVKKLILVKSLSMKWYA